MFAIISALLLVLPCWLDVLRCLPGPCDVVGGVWVSALGGITLFGYFFGEEELWLVLGTRSMELGEYMMFVCVGEERFLFFVVVVVVVVCMRTLCLVAITHSECFYDARAL